MNRFYLVLFLVLLFPSIIISQSLTLKEQLGKAIYFDNIAEPDVMSCASCHAPQAGFAGPKSGMNRMHGVYMGAVMGRFGNRRPPTSAYATYSPILTYNGEEFSGGNFWDGRATGERLGSPAAEQALGPFLNPLEHNVASKKAVLIQIASAGYSTLWRKVWGKLDYSTDEKINLNYDRVGLSIAAYEASKEVNSFTSKYDSYVNFQTELTAQELEGMNLFNGIAMCSSCHTSESSGGVPALFTNFTYDNVGTPKNPNNPFYRMDQVYIDGAPVNPEGSAWIDKGLGGYLQTLSDDNPWKTLAAENIGKHKVPTLRNVDKRPGYQFTKAYMHNGVFLSLKEVVHFFNTRDIASWAPPEVAQNVTNEVGDLGLTASQEDAIVAFLSTLSDGSSGGSTGGGGMGGGGCCGQRKPAVFSVYGPNPFNPSTTLNYYIAEDANIQLYIYNVAGEIVMKLQDGFMSAGEHRVEFNAGNLASGIYLATLHTGNELKTLKLILMK